MPTRTLLAILLSALVALSSAGCVENMRDLKDRIQPAAEQELDAADVDANETLDGVTNATNATPSKPPVARMSVFGANNALVYQSTFVGEDATDPVFVQPEIEVTLLAADSTALEPGATLISFAWTVNGQTLSGAKATTTFAEPGLYPVTLTVTDSEGGVDNQTVPLAVAPQPYTVELSLTTSAVVGAEGQGQSGTAAFDLTAANEPTPAKITGVKVVAEAMTTCDHILDVHDKDGQSVAGSVDSEGAGAAEELSLGALPEGAYTVVVGPFACVAPDGVPVTVHVTFLPIVEGLGEGDGHGGHAH